MAQGTLGYLKKLVGEFGSITATKFTGMFAAAAVAKMAFDKVTESMAKNMQTAKQISSLSAKFHIDPKQVHSLLLAANDAGVSVRSLLQGMKTLGGLASKALVDKNSMAVFKQLGMDVDKVGEIAEKPAKQFAEIARLLMTIDNETDRAAYGTKLLGRQYQQMLPLIEKLGTSAEARANFLNNENAMTKEQVEANKAIAKMQSEMSEAWDKLVAAIAPYILQLTAMVNLLFDAANWWGKILETSRKVNQEERARQFEVSRDDMRKYDKEREEYLAAKERLTEANSKLTNTSKRLGEQTGSGYGQQAGFYGPGKDSKGRETVGLNADMRILRAFEEKYAQKGTRTQFFSGSTYNGETESRPSVIGANFVEGPDASKSEPETATHKKIRELEAQKAALSEQESGDYVHRGFDISKGLYGAISHPFGLNNLSSVGLVAEGMSKAIGAAQRVLGDDYEGQHKALDDQLKTLREQGNLEDAVLEEQKKKKELLEEERRARVKYMERFLLVAGMQNTHYIDRNGNIIEGRKPEEGMSAPVEDVDAKKKADARKKRKRALAHKVAREMRDVGDVEGAEQELELTTREQAEHTEEDLEPKRKDYLAKKKAYEDAKKQRDEFIEKYGVQMRDDSGKPMVDAEGKPIKGIRKSDTKLHAEYTGIAKGYEGAKGAFETAEADLDKEESKATDLANAKKKAERELWRAKKADADYALKDMEDGERALHERRVKMMEMEGKTKKEMLEENFKFEVAKLEDALEQYDELKEEYESDGVITADEEKALKAAKEKVDAQSGKAESSMFALANADKPWQVASDMRAIGGGGKILGTSGNVAIDQLEVLKGNLPASKAYLAQITALLGGGMKKSGDVATRTNAPTYGTVKGTVPSQPPAPSPYYVDNDGKVQNGADVGHDPELEPEYDS